MGFFGILDVLECLEFLDVLDLFGMFGIFGMFWNVGSWGFLGIKRIVFETNCFRAVCTNKDKLELGIAAPHPGGYY